MVLAVLLYGVLFSSPSGWTAELVTRVDRDKIEQQLRIVDIPTEEMLAQHLTVNNAGPEQIKTVVLLWRCGPESGRHIRIIHNDPQGFWVCCDIRGLEGKSFEVWRETKGKVYLRDGRAIESSRILATADPCGFQLLDNAVTPFLVTERTHGYNGTVRLYLRFDEKFDLDEVMNWHFSMARTRVDPASPQERQGQPK
jgi:hypothetical protein